MGWFVVVIIRLRGKDELGSTFIKTLEQYSLSLQAVGSVLILAGLSSKVHAQLVATKSLNIIGENNTFLATHQVGDSLQSAMDAAAAWKSER